MGRRTLPPFIDDLRGKFSKIVFSANLAGPYFRKYVIPKNPKTIAQKDMRSIISDVSKDWQSLTESQQSFWRNYLPTLKTWYIGAAENLSAFNAFTMVASQIKTGIEVTGFTTIQNNNHWTKTAFTYSKTVQPAGRPPLALRNIQSFDTVVDFDIVGGVPKIKLTVNLTNNNMAINDYLECTDGRKVSFVIWISNPGKYITSNMKPMVMKVLSTGKLQIIQAGTSVTQILANADVNNTYYSLAPKTQEYVLYTLALQAEDGPYTIIKEEVIQVV
jgi:hypothetical protein